MDRYKRQLLRTSGLDEMLESQEAARSASPRSCAISGDRGRRALRVATIWNSRTRASAVALILLATLLALIYVALTIYGFGDCARFARNPVRPAIAGALVLFAAITPLCGCHIAPAIEEDHGNDWIFFPLLLMGLTMGWLSAYCDRHNSWTVRGDGVRYVGLIVFLAGVGLRVTAIRTLGRRFSVWVAIQADHQLETSGIYRWVRHPSYTGAIMNLLGWAMVFRSIAGMTLAIAMGLLLVSRIRAEEMLLIAAFGSEYEEYQNRSWKLVPFLY